MQRSFCFPLIDSFGPERPARTMSLLHGIAPSPQRLMLPPTIRECHLCIQPCRFTTNPGFEQGILIRRSKDMCLATRQNFTENGHMKTPLRTPTLKTQIARSRISRNAPHVSADPCCANRAKHCGCLESISLNLQGSRALSRYRTPDKIQRSFLPAPYKRYMLTLVS